MCAGAPYGEPGGGLKFEVQLYRLKEERYLVDVQRLEGDLMSYFDVAGELLAALRLAT